MKILVIAAHPDDEVLGCGGTIHRLSGEGHDISIAILGEGVTSRYAQRAQADSSLVRQLHDTSRKVASFLGAKTVFNYTLPDNRFDTVPLLDVVKLIEGVVEAVGPDIVYTHSGGDLNVDHRVVFEATLTATRPVAGTLIRKLYAYEVPSSTEWAFQRMAPVFHPAVYMDIGKALKKKLDAMKMYDGELRQFPHPRSIEAIRTTARRWGTVSGLEAAEAFELIREIL
jgi:N-acetylglucosamine malate deacetylase 1